MTAQTEAVILEGEQSGDLLTLSAGIVSAYVGHNIVQQVVIPELIRTIHASLVSLERREAKLPAEKVRPAVPVSRSVQHDYLVCLEDGKHLKMLKRYLRSHYDMSPEAYRQKWGLSADYPMVAPAYAARRSEFAKQIGLGKGVRRGL
ncbi:MucR family transcriptional regulator [Caulobacter henricii]|uniref:MucR family transcriptional regulator n=1 Tax=Caulobacter henricii TaxID=69395 RepID=A0A0P0NZT1_9CAUL|nr:MucR family transcriptional regulator [Caulobacter henricii]ALL13644.1 hypothetical protein AQ619_09975 [Caulobacter henricii]